MVEFDVSSNVLHRIGDNGNAGQVGATFYGPLVYHVTSALLWVTSNGTATSDVVTILAMMNSNQFTANF